MSRRTALGILGTAVGAVAIGDALGTFGAPAAHAEVAPFPIVNWWTSRPIEASFADHKARTPPSVNPGTDFGMPVGTQLRAPHEGSASFQQWAPLPNGLWQINIVHPSGWRSELLHISGTQGSFPRSVALGEVVALSGGQPGTPGSGTATGPHVHWTLKNPAGVQVDAPLYANTSATGIPLPPLTTQNRQVEMELYAANPPATIPAKYLALNGGLVTGVPIYMLIPAVGIPRITEDQSLVSKWAQSIFGQASAQAVIQISWGWFDQMFDQQYAIAHSLGAS